MTGKKENDDDNDDDQPVFSCIWSSSDESLWVALDVLELYPLLREFKL